MNIRAAGGEYKTNSKHLIDCQRPYHAENTGSRLISEVKQHRAGLVLLWVTEWESPVSLAPFLPLFAHSVDSQYVCFYYYVHILPLNNIIIYLCDKIYIVIRKYTYILTLSSFIPHLPLNNIDLDLVCLIGSPKTVYCLLAIVNCAK